MCAAMLRATSAAPRLRAVEGRDLLVLGADQRALVVVQRRPVDRAGQAVLGVLALASARRSRRRTRRSRASASARGESEIRPCGHQGLIASSSSLSICDLLAVLLQRRAVDQEGVLDPLAQRGDLGQLQVDVVARQHAGDGVEQAGAVAGRHAEQPALRALVGPQRDARRDREGLARAARRARGSARAAARRRPAPARAASRPARSGRGSARVLASSCGLMTWKVSSA